MGKWSWERLAAATGLAFIALLIASAAIFSPPSATKPAQKITAYFLHHHRAGIVSGVLSGVAVIFFLWAMGSLAAALRERRRASTRDDRTRRGGGDCGDGGGR